MSNINSISNNSPIYTVQNIDYTENKKTSFSQLEDILPNDKNFNPQTILPKPTEAVNLSIISTSFASFGANILAIITQASNEQKRLTYEMKALQTAERINKIDEQANLMKSKAIAQFAIGVCTGALTLAQGTASVAITSKGISDINQRFSKPKTDNITKQPSTITETTTSTTKTTSETNITTINKPETKTLPNTTTEEKITETTTTKITNKTTKQKFSNCETKEQADTWLNSKTQLINSIFSGSNGMLGGISDFIASGYDGQIQSLDLDQEQMKITEDLLEKLAESFKELLQKAIQTQNAIQENTNQTRTKILG